MSSKNAPDRPGAFLRAGGRGASDVPVHQDDVADEPLALMAAEFASGCPEQERAVVEKALDGNFELAVVGVVRKLRLQGAQRVGLVVQRQLLDGIEASQVRLQELVGEGAGDVLLAGHVHVQPVGPCGVQDVEHDHPKAIVRERCHGFTPFGHVAISDSSRQE